MSIETHALWKIARLALLVLVACLYQTVFGQTLIHPGCLSTQADLNRMTAMVQTGVHPWIDSWNILTNNSFAQTNYTPNPQGQISRTGTGGNYQILANDIAAAYQCALRYYGSGDTNYANKSVQIMNAWAGTLTNLTGDPNIGLLPLQGYQFACVGELMRTYNGWNQTNFANFTNMMFTLWYPLCNSFLTNHDGTCDTYIWANWDLCNMACMLSLGVLCDNRSVYNQAINYYETGVGNGAANQVVYYLHPGYMGQCQESGRDQGHCTLDPISLGVFCEIAWNQGDDMYGYNTNCLLAISEYVCKYNIQPFSNTVPYVDFCDCNEDVQDVVSTNSRGTVRPGWDLIYNHYVNIRGLSAPYTAQMAAQIRPEGGGGDYGGSGGGFDQLGFTTLTHTLTPIATNALPLPSGLMAQVRNNAVTLSWWGSAYASSYNVKRALSNSGPYTNIASGLTGSLYYTDVGLLPGVTYYYVISAVVGGLEGGNSLPVSAQANTQLNGAVIGSPGSFNSFGDTIANVYDGAVGSYYDAADVSGDWAGLDLGVSNIITQIAYCPRAYFASRMVGGQFQGANVADFSSGVVTLFTVNIAPLDTETNGEPGTLTTQAISNTNSFRYVRYIGPVNGSCNVSEVQFFGYPSPASVPVAPTDLIATPGNTQILLNWNASAGATSFNVQRSLVSGGPYTTVATGLTTTTYLDLGLANYSNYYYVVSAVNATGQSANSAEVVAMPAPSSMTNVIWSGAVDGIWDTTTLNWLTNGATVTYQNGDPVIFDDTASANTAVTVSATVSPASVIFNNSVKNYSISGSPIAGTCSLVMLGSGTITLDGANIFSGGTTINQGMVTVGNNSALGTGTVMLSGGTLFGGSSGYTLANPIQLQSNTTSTIDCSGNLTLNGNLAGSGNISRGASAPQTLYLGGNNSDFTGTYQDQNSANSITRWNSQNAGSANARWIFNQAQIASRTTPDFGSGTIQFGSVSGNGYVSQNTSGTATLQVGALGLDDTFSGSIQDGGGGFLALTKVGTGTLTMTGTNNYSGLTTVSDGELLLASSFVNKGCCLITNGAVLGVTNLSAQSAAISNLTLAAGCVLKFINVADSTTPLLMASNLSVGAGCTVEINGTNGLVARSSFPLVNYAGTLSGFTNLLLQTPYGWRGALVNVNKEIILTNVAVVATTPPQISAGITNGQFQILWPGDHTGWRLMMQTNLADTNWLNVPGSASTNLTSIPATNSSLFLRLVYP
jgi:autotransporter-associated beta strand protein